MPKKKSVYAARQQIKQDITNEVVRSMERQFMLDMMAMALSNKYGFDEDQISALCDELTDLYGRYIDMFNPRHPEADALRFALDVNLQRLVPRHFAPFDVRYPYACTLKI